MAMLLRRYAVRTFAPVRAIPARGMNEFFPNTEAGAPKAKAGTRSCVPYAGRSFCRSPHTLHRSRLDSE